MAICVSAPWRENILTFSAESLVGVWGGFDGAEIERFKFSNQRAQGCDLLQVDRLFGFHGCNHHAV